jgi:hypothetical protein
MLLWGCAAECKSECYSLLIFLHKEGSIGARFWRYRYKSAFGIHMYIPFSLIMKRKIHTTNHQTSQDICCCFTWQFRCSHF